MPGIAGEARLEETVSDRAREQGGVVGEDDIARDPKVARRPAAHTKAMIMAHEVHHGRLQRVVRPVRRGQGSQSQA